MINLWGVGVIFLACLATIEASCSFPSYLNGTWISSVKNELVFSNTTITDYPTSKFGTLSFTCSETSGSEYVAKSTPITLYSITWEIYLCFNFTEISSTKYMYYLGSVVNTQADDERIKAYVSGSTVTLDTVCDRTTYDAGTEHLLIQSGTADSSKITCPSSLLGQWNYTFTSSGTTTCGAGSDVNICSSPDDQTMAYNYTACSTVQAYSATGVLYCMYSSESSAGVTYLHVYNNDSSTDQSNTYRFTCYALDLNDTGSGVYGTQYPSECHSTQNSTYVPSPGASIVYSSSATTTTSSSTSTTSDVVSMASAIGIVLGLIMLIVIALCAALAWYYYKKRKTKKELDKIKMPVQKKQPANKRLANVDIFIAGKEKDIKPPPSRNGDVSINMDTDPDIRRENSICVSVASRGGSGLPGMLSGTESRGGPAPVEEPEKVNYIHEENTTIMENDEAVEETLASTFLPISAGEKGKKFDEKLIKVDQDVEHYNFSSQENRHNSDLDDIDDELGLPRLSGAFTPVLPPDPAPLPTIKYKRKEETESETEEERTADGVLKVKLKKRKRRRRKRVVSAKGKERIKSAGKHKEHRETPFLERLKKQDEEIAKAMDRSVMESRLKSNAANGDVSSPRGGSKARLSKAAKQNGQPLAGSKYMVDGARTEKLRSSDKRALRDTSEEQRRRFGDPIPERKGRKRTPRLRHPMEFQTDTPELKGQKEAQQVPPQVQPEERTKSGRRRQQPDQNAIPTVQEDPFDHRENIPATSAVSQARTVNSLKLGLEREGSLFFDPPKDPTEDEIWQKASNMWNHRATHGHR